MSTPIAYFLNWIIQRSLAAPRRARQGRQASLLAILKSSQGRPAQSSTQRAPCRGCWRICSCIGNRWAPRSEQSSMVRTEYATDLVLVLFVLWG